jgi:CRP/FNR family cyclic AMP-dependent transcriptional regulator
MIKRPADQEFLCHFLEIAPWFRALSSQDRGRVRAAARVVQVREGGEVIRCGELAEHWFGVIDGLLVQALTIDTGEFTELATVGPGIWFGEGTLLKRERWRYDVVALRRSSIVLIPLEVFAYLRNTSLPFNQFISDLLNARLGMCVGLLVADRLLDPESKVARLLASLCMSEQLAAQGHFIPLRQEEIARLAGLSRQRTNMALHALKERRYITVERTGVTILDLIGLRTLEPPRNWLAKRGY